MDTLLLEGAAGIQTFPGTGDLDADAVAGEGGEDGVVEGYETWSC